MKCKHLKSLNVKGIMEESRCNDLSIYTEWGKAVQVRCYGTGINDKIHGMGRPRNTWNGYCTDTVG